MASQLPCQAAQLKQHHRCQGFSPPGVKVAASHEVAQTDRQSSHHRYIASRIARQLISMPTANAHPISRRSSRMQISIPVLVTRVEGGHFSEVCKTSALNAHGCAIFVPVRLEAGVPLHFQLKSGRHTTAQVVECEPLASDRHQWRLGVSFDQPGNFWGLDPCPEDWSRPQGKTIPKELPATLKPATATPEQDSHQRQALTPTQLGPEPAKVQLSDERVRAIVAELVQPLQEEIVKLRGRPATEEPKRGQFEISLSHIPAEVQELLREQLQQDLGDQVLSHTREQSERMLKEVMSTIEQKTDEMQGKFQQRASGELHSLEQRAHALSEEIALHVKQSITGDLEGFHQQISDAAARLEERANALTRHLQQRFSEEHDTRRREMQVVHAGVAAESSRLQGCITDLDSRVANLHKAASSLESDLDDRLARMATEIVLGARTQLESAVETILHELGQRNARNLESQLEQACKRLKSIQGEAEASASELLKTEIAQKEQLFEETIEQLAQHSVERWRLALAFDLESLSKMLSKQLRPKKPGDNDTQSTGCLDFAQV